MLLLLLPYNATPLGWGGEGAAAAKKKRRGEANVEKRERLRKGTAFAGARTKHLQFAPLVPPFRMQAALLEEGGEAAASHTLTDEECVRGRRR